ncbi:MAG: pyridoxamine 5'-phosphate oxidase family protein [Pseudomonadota bacterium]
MDRLISDIAFTDAVKARQEQMGSRRNLERRAATRDWSDEITADLAAYLAERNSFYMATVSSDGHPYIQHRGGPKGFLKVLNPKQLGFADFAGNRQYISTGNLDGNDRVHLFVTDYANSQRIKLWGRAQVVDDDPAMLAQLTVAGYQAKPERAFLIDVEAWDSNCPQHLPELHSVDTIQMVTTKMGQQIAQLQAENAELKAWLGDKKPD